MDRAPSAAASSPPAAAFEAFPRAALERSIPERFEQIARRYSDRSAVTTPGEILTYAALDRAAARVASGILARFGAGVEPIALLLERDAPQVVATLAVLKAGKVYVPLDSTFPEDRLRATVESAQPALVVVDPRTAPLGARLVPPSVPVLRLEELEADPAAAPAPPVSADTLASITLPLARHLGADQPVWGLVPRGLDGRSAPVRTMEALAAAYVEEVRRLQPRGPYALVGYCFGGIVAFEMAQQLRARGEDVRLLALLEPPWEGGRSRARRALRRARRRLAFEWSRLRARSGPARVGYALGRAATLAHDQAARLRRAGARARWLRGAPETLLERAVREVAGANAEALRRYAPRVYPGHLTLFGPPDLPARFHGDPHMGWAGLAAQGITVEQIPGRYRAIVEDEPARLVAARLARHLAAAAEPTGEARATRATPGAER